MSENNEILMTVIGDSGEPAAARHAHAMECVSAINHLCDGVHSRVLLFGAIPCALDTTGSVSARVDCLLCCLYQAVPTLVRRTIRLWCGIYFNTVFMYT